MSGIILATGLGAFGATAAATVGTGAMIAAGVGAGTTLYGGAKSFSNANKARKRGQAAEEAARKSVEEARRNIDINRMEQLSIAKEPYELMRDALLTQGATGLQAGVEGETRGAAATAGRLQMAQNLRQGEVRGEMGQRMDEINKLVAQEDKRIDQQLSGIALQEAAGAQQAIRDAEEDRAAYLTQGVGTLGSIAQGLSTSYAEGNFGQGRQYNPEGMANTAETIRSGDLGQNRGYELTDGSVLNPNIDLDSYAAFGGTVPNGPEANAQVRQGRRAERQFARQDRRVANDIQRAEAQNQRQLNRLEGQPFLPPGPANPSPMQQRRAGPIDPFDLFGGGGFTPPSPVNATRGEARASVAPAGVGGPVAPAPAPAPAPERRPVEARSSVVGSSENAARSKMEANIERTRGLEGAELVKARESIETNQGEDGKWTATYTPPAQESRAGVQSVGDSETARELLERLRTEGQEPIATPNPTSKEIESVNTEALEKAAEVGPAAEEVVRSATEGVTSSNPLPIAMQWLNVREPNYREYDPAKGDSVYVKTPTITPEGQKLLTEVWAGVGQTEAGQKSYIKQEQAWCAGFVNMVLADSNLTASLIGKNQKGRADMYMSAKFGENIFTNESIKRSNLHQDLKGQPEKYGFPKVKGSVKDAKTGDVVIINRPNGKRPDSRHVGFFAGYDKDGNMKVLGGNQGDEVNVTVYNSSDVIGIRRVNQPDLTDKQLEAVSKIVTRKEGATR
jgi:hypothetical protein